MGSFPGISGKEVIAKSGSCWLATVRGDGLVDLFKTLVIEMEGASVRLEEEIC